MTPGAGVLVLGHSHISENAIFLLLLFTLGHGSDKLSICVVMMTKERSTKIMFHNPVAVVLMLGRGHISHYSENVLSSTICIVH